MTRKIAVSKVSDLTAYCQERMTTLKVMEPSWHHYYNISKRLLSLAGQWPYQGKREKFFRSSLLTVAIFSIIVPQVSEIVHCDGNRRCIMITIPMFIVAIVVLLKVYTCQFNSSKIKNLIDHVREDWDKLKDAEELEIMKTYAVNVRLWSLIYFLWTYAAGIVFFLSIGFLPQILNVVLPLNESRPKIMPIKGHYFIDEEKYFFFIFFQFSVSLCISFIGIVAHDCMFLSYIEHVCSLFALAAFRFETLSRSDRNDVANDNLDSWKIYNRKIAVSVHTHWRALRFAEILEDIFCVPFAVQMMLVVIALSVTLLQVTLEFDKVEVMKYMMSVIAQVIHLFCYSVQGQKLINHSMQIRDKIYNSSWYEIPAKSQKLLLHVMRRSMEPNSLSAGKIYIFSLKSFSTVMQTSVSYFTVLASFQ